MTDTVGVHISETQICAVRFDSSSSGPPLVVVLGESRPAAAAVVAQGAGGSVLVGDEAALVTEGPRVTNPLQRAATGRIGALVAVLSFVVRRAADAEGKPPDRLAVVIDDDYRRAARDRIVQAGISAGIADTVVVPHAAASAQPTPFAGGAALAAGAARVGSMSAAQFVTREDLGQPITAKTPVAPVAEAPGPESVSVFEDDSAGRAGRAARRRPEQLSQVSSGEPGELGAPRVVGPAVGPSVPRGTEMPRRTGLSQATITLALVLLVGVVGGLLILLAGDESGNIRTTPDTVGEETTPVETEPPTTAATTSEPALTSSTSEPPTTEPPVITSTTTSTTTTTTTTTTTIKPVGVGSPGPVTLVETGLQFDTGRVVQFGQPMSEVIDAVRSVLGAPDRATNFAGSEACVENTRAVRWGQLELVFQQDPPVEVLVDPDSQGPSEGTEFIPASTGTFGQWYATGHTSPTGLVTRDGLGVSATVGFLEVTYGASFVFLQPAQEEESTEEQRGVFSISNPASGGVIHGTTSDVTPEGRVLNLWAGNACTRTPI